MVGVGGRSGLSRFGIGARVMTQRLVPVSANEFFVVAPVIGGAMAYRFIRNNLADPSVPPLSIGGPYEPWRLGGAGWLGDPARDPADADFWWSNDVGAQDYALQWSGNGVFGGSYHGGEATTRNLVLANGVPVDPTQARTATSFSLQVAGTITWSAGNVATIADHLLTVNPDGSLSEVLPIASTLSFASAYLGMLIAGEGYTEARLNAEGWTVPLAAGRAILLQHDDVTIRNPGNGRWIRSVANARALPGYSRTQFENTPTRSKLYHRFTGVLDARTVARTVSYGTGAPSPSATGANLLANGDFAAGLAGWTVQAGTQASTAAGGLRLARQAGSDNRVYQAFPAVPGAVYRATCRADAASDVGGLFGITSAANGSASTPTPPLMQSLYVNGAPSAANLQIWVADRPVHYFMCRQGPGPAGQTLGFADCAVHRLSPG